MIFRELEPTGYLASVLPSEAGGKGLSALAFAVLVEGLAPDLTLLGNHSVQRYLHSFGSADQCRRFMPGLLSGEEIGAIAITEAQAGSDLARIETVARRFGDRYVLNGRKTWVTHGTVASTFIVLARTGDNKDQFTRFIVPATAWDLQRSQQKPVGMTHRSFADLEFSDCEVETGLNSARGEGAKSARKPFRLRAHLPRCKRCASAVPRCRWRPIMHAHASLRRSRLPTAAWCSTAIRACRPASKPPGCCVFGWPQTSPHQTPPRWLPPPRRPPASWRSMPAAGHRTAWDPPVLAPTIGWCGYITTHG